MESLESDRPSFSQRYKRVLILGAFPVLIAVIVAGYFASRPRQAQSGTVYTLKVGALPVT